MRVGDEGAIVGLAVPAITPPPIGSSSRSGCGRSSSFLRAETVFGPQKVDTSSRIAGPTKETFTFDPMAEAHRYLEQSGQFGKIVVTV
jgi:Zinc-binding dehydrogenase